MSNTISTLHFRAYDEQGKMLKSTYTKNPIQILHGQNSIDASLEQEILNMEVGQHKEVQLCSCCAHGDYQLERLKLLPKKWFDNTVPNPSSICFESGGPQYKIIHQTDEAFLVDLNHPFAGKNICYKIELIDRYQFPSNVIHINQKAMNANQLLL